LDGRFQIEEVLGTGGMSIVYKATQLRVNRHVAIKTLRLQLDTKDIYRERFQREISSLCALNHPNIVTVYDAIIGPDDQPYVVMDYLRGRSLEALIEDEGPMSVERFARIAIQICSALEHAHKKGIIHRDLKPGNVVLMDDEMDFVKVVDFGLAKIGDQNRRLTHSGELWGSPPYMSPEQCMGEPQDQRSDLYSIGAVMYEMLTGTDPYRNATTVFEFIKFHTSVPPPPMNSVNAKIQVPQKVEAVVFKALEKDPARRYQTAKELQDAIVEASSASVDREKGEFLFHLANQASTKPPSGQSYPQPESTEASITASQAFKRALNPFADEMLHEASADDGEASAAAPQAAGQAPGQTESQDSSQGQSFSPSVQRWRTPGSPAQTQPEIVQPVGEVVQPAGEVVPPPPANPPANPAANAAANPAAIPPKIAHPVVSAEASNSSNPWLLVVLLATVAILAYVWLPGLLGHVGNRPKGETPAATSTGETPVSGTDGTRAITGADDQLTSGQADKDKGGKKDGSKSPDGVSTPKIRARHPHTAARAQAAGRTIHPAATTGQAGASPVRSNTPAPHPSARPAHAGGQADPWKNLENMR
jgi:serine/threonine-protein kinase